jgi:hypothetical protein
VHQETQQKNSLYVTTHKEIKYLHEAKVTALKFLISAVEEFYMHAPSKTTETLDLPALSKLNKVK